MTFHATAKHANARLLSKFCMQSSRYQLDIMMDRPLSWLFLLLIFTVVVLQPVIAAALPPAADYASCLTSTTCSSLSFGCFKKPSAHVAECLPVGTHCVAADTVTSESDALWLCPGWHLCAARNNECTESHCCQSTQDTCFAKGQHYAACLPNKEACEEKGADWSCEALSPTTTCSADGKACTGSRCCASDGFVCYAKHEHYARCLRGCPVSLVDPAKPDEELEGWTCALHDKKHLASPPTPAPPPAPVRVCTSLSEDFGACYESQCCKHAPGFGCFKKVGKVRTGLPVVDSVRYVGATHVMVDVRRPCRTEANS